MKRKLICILLVLSIGVISAACSKISDEEIPERKVYDIAIDYVGTKLESSEYVPNITKYSSLSGYKASSEQSKVLWIDESMLEGDYSYVSSLYGSKDTIIVLSEGSDKKTLTKNIEDYEYKDTTKGNERFLGVIFADVGSPSKDPVGIYTTGKTGARETEYLAFCSEYNYKKYYQGNNFVTDIYPTEKLGDYLNMFNFEDNAYAASFITLIDFIDNPGRNGADFEFQYTVANYVDVTPVQNLLSKVVSKIDAGEGAWSINQAPKTDSNISVGDKDEWNFLFNRFFDLVKETDHYTTYKVLTKGNMVEELSWSAENFDSTFMNNLSVASSMGMTSAADLINLTGRYISSGGGETILKDAEGKELTYSFTVSFDEIAIVWGDDYEE